MIEEPGQTDEVVNRLTAKGECAIVDPQTEVEVWLFFERSYEREPYEIISSLRLIPNNSVLHAALELGFRLELGQGDYLLERRCFGIRAAAIRALGLATILSGADSATTFWITAVEPDFRDDPPASP